MRKIILFISAFVPMYMLILIKDILDIINDNITLNVTNTIVLISLSVLILLGIIGSLCIDKISKGDALTITVRAVDNVTGQYFFGYFSLFVLLAVNFDMCMICEIVTFVLINIMIGVVYVHNNLYFINPFLNILGYNICNITYETEDKKQACIKVFTKSKVIEGSTIDIKTMFNYNYNKTIE